ncbi:MAG: PhoH family protein [Firmicutes bacterium]|nr:PhoH family protein [Bacillota bacterium]
MLEDTHEAITLLGKHDETLKALERIFGVTIAVRGNELVFSGAPDQVDKVLRVLQDLQGLLRLGSNITIRDVKYAAKLARDNEDVTLSDLASDIIQVTARGKQVRPKTLGQKRYVDAIRRSGLVFAIGPAGTGKTYLAMAMAIAALKSREVSRIVLTRPAVEAGERLGFLPGDLQDKVDPYLRPLYDAIYDILGAEIFQKYMEKGIIEVAPLAYMRGRTLDDSFIILDEAQNTTHEQMKMFLTRLGFGSKAVVTGDITQIDLPRRKFSGLEEVQAILRGIDGIEFIYLTDQDVVRHELVQKIIRAYEKFEGERASE